MFKCLTSTLAWVITSLAVLSLLLAPSTWLRSSEAGQWFSKFLLPYGLYASLCLATISSHAVASWRAHHTDWHGPSVNSVEHRRCCNRSLHIGNSRWQRFLGFTFAASLLHIIWGWGLALWYEKWCRTNVMDALCVDSYALLKPNSWSAVAGQRLAHSISTAFGLAAVFCMIPCLVPVTRSAGALNLFWFGVTQEHAIAIHRYLGWSALNCLLAHGCGYICLWLWQGGWHKLLAELTSWAGHVPNAPGVLAFFTAIALGITSIEVVRRHWKRYELFYHVHVISFILLFMGSAAHWAGFCIYLSPGLAMWAADRTIRFFRRRNANIVCYRLLPHDAADGEKLAHTLEVWLAFPNVSNHVQDAFRPGQYAMIRCPSVAWSEWHPISIASASGERPPRGLAMSEVNLNDFMCVRFLLKPPQASPCGWVANVVRAFDTDFDRLPNLQLEGIYGDDWKPRWQTYLKPGGAPVMFFAGGIGITPILAILRRLAQCTRNELPWPNASSLPQIVLIWTVRYQEEFEQIGEEELSIVRQGGLVSIQAHLYVTKGSSASLQGSRVLWIEPDLQLECTDSYSPLKSPAQCSCSLLVGWKPALFLGFGMLAGTAMLPLTLFILVYEETCHPAPHQQTCGNIYSILHQTVERISRLGLVACAAVAFTLIATLGSGITVWMRKCCMEGCRRARELEVMETSVCTNRLLQRELQTLGKCYRKPISASESVELQPECEHLGMQTGFDDQEPRSAWDGAATVHFGRPNIGALLAQQSKGWDDDAAMGVFASGPRSLLHDVEHHCVQASANSKLAPVEFHALSTEF